MDEEVVPKRRPTDPVPGTRGPQRGNNDAFKVKETLARKSAPEPTPPKPYEGVLWRYRKQGIDEQVDRAVGQPKEFKKGGLVRGWGKARKR